MHDTPLTILQNPPLSNAQCAAIAALYRAVGWGSPGTTAELRDLYEYSSYFLLALDGEQVVGLLRAESETAQTTWLAEIAVLPRLQLRGTGLALMARFLADHPDRTLYTDATEGVEEFFLRHGIALRRPRVPGPRQVDA
ncbi:GNAT family N-acetyltransferase [Pseudomonas sp. GD04087]|uniref:GNAT family N-acetyltransferase n=1 Tax=Pseudomonas multiresinivorans TaxID=95301 RepID=A0A7Z3BGR9_9PSED|nr:MULTISPECIES: GNAT family N-acetyltransferase [Pseudomonas]MCP1648794.1 N-acetylglutamate synthase-like GNAT family acetyltransferase [Pseudomonas nitroreducens]MCP1687368.1 N-acetylglutamate synthase-like GNAT family acetyltransferase [Pseudomonas nitroreducens]MDH0292707.1 GNAT family N-acetyltransferase [Pseudomonas sp. GD04087]MDH1052051.1 GNAT family N-acetyltransferase [Pseudomonas sp. GD03903]MDH2002320.1 GNAT family N-acetyltransferase [Pseudomonas sp. GD03691]